MEYKGRAFYESVVLCEFLEDVYPDTPRLLPADPSDRAHARMWIDFITKSVVPSIQRLVQAQEPDKQKTALQDAMKALRTVAETAKGPWFLGEQFSLVDIMLAPWIIRDYIMSEHRGYSRETVGNGWKEYAERLESRESVLKTQSVSHVASRVWELRRLLVLDPEREALRGDLSTIPSRRSPE